MGSVGRWIDKETGDLFDPAAQAAKQAQSLVDEKQKQDKADQAAEQLKQQAEDENKKTQLAYISAIRGSARGYGGSGQNQTLGGG